MRFVVPAGRSRRWGFVLAGVVLLGWLSTFGRIGLGRPVPAAAGRAAENGAPATGPARASRQAPARPPVHGSSPGADGAAGRAPVRGSSADAQGGAGRAPAGSSGAGEKA